MSQDNAGAESHVKFSALIALFFLNGKKIIFEYSMQYKIYLYKINIYIPTCYWHMYLWTCISTITSPSVRI